MKLTITKRAEEPLLLREKITAKIEFDAAVPARKDILNEVAKKADSKPELVVVNHIYGDFGSKKAEVFAYAYKNIDALKRIEEKKVLARTGLKQEKPAEAKTEAAKPAEVKQ